MGFLHLEQRLKVGSSSGNGCKGQLDAVATQDWDALLYGAPTVIETSLQMGAKEWEEFVLKE